MSDWPDPTVEFRRTINLEIMRIAGAAIDGISGIVLMIEGWHAENPAEPRFTNDDLASLLVFRRNIERLLESMPKTKKREP